MRGSVLAILIALLGPAQGTAQRTAWLNDVDGRVSVLHTDGFFGAEVGDPFVWNRVILNTSDSAQAPSFPSCDVTFDAPWIGRGETSCDVPDLILPGDSAFVRFDARIVAPPDSSGVEVREEWLWPIVLYSWEVGTDRLTTIPTVRDLIEITRVEMSDARIQAGRGHPTTLTKLAERYSTVRFELYLPTHGSAALRGCLQHAPSASSRCIYSELSEFESTWITANEIGDALEEMLPRVRDRLMAR